MIKEMILFYIVSIVGFYFFTFTKRKFDFFTLGYFSSLLYFMPGFFGHVSYKSNFNLIINPIIPETYMVFNTVLFSIILFSFLFDKINKNIILITNKKIKGEQYSGNISLYIAIFSLIMLISTVGDKLFIPQKSEMMSALNQWMSILLYTSSLSAVILFNQKKYYSFALSTILLLFILYIGFRFPFVIVMLSLIILKLNEYKKLRLIKFWKILLYGLFLLISMLLYKSILFSLKAFNTELLFTLLSDPSYLLLAFTAAEPFETQSILNEIIKSNFQVPITQLTHFSAFFIFEIEQIGLDIPSFNSYFQHSLFPGVRSGMASNIWAQFWSIGQWFSLILFIIFYNFILYIFSLGIRVKSNTLKSTFALMGSYWAFYIQRNDLAYILAVEKKTLIISFIILIISSLYMAFKSKHKLRYE